MAGGGGELVLGLAALALTGIGLGVRYVLGSRIFVRFRLRSAIRRLAKTIEKSCRAANRSTPDIQSIQQKIDAISVELQEKPRRAKLLDASAALSSFATQLVSRPFELQTATNFRVWSLDELDKLSRRIADARPGNRTGKKGA